MNRVERMDSGSQLFADPDLQLLNKKTARDITKQVKDVYKVQKTGAGWQDKAISAAIVLAAAIALIVLGFLGSTSFAIGIGIALAAYGLFQAGQAVMKGSNEKKSDKVHEDATVLRLSETVKKNQDQNQIEMGRMGYDPRGRRQFSRRQEFGSYMPAPAQGGRGGYIPAGVDVSDDT
ncbi:MAG: hypothetical protein K1X28_05815 [Parachlamydiales bacterium]|nr:hypothetical protein [Parachlamydiales bacterium]